MAYIYFLISLTNNNTSYIGWTYDLKKRIKKHNDGKGAKFTRGKKWKLIYFEVLKSKNLALKREYELKKNKKLRNFIKNMFKNKNILDEK